MNLDNFKQAVESQKVEIHWDTFVQKVDSFS